MRRDTIIEIGRTYAGVLVAVRVALWRPSTFSRVIVMSVLGEHQCHILGYPSVRLAVAAHITVHWPQVPSFAFTWLALLVAGASCDFSSIQESSTAVWVCC